MDDESKKSRGMFIQGGASIRQNTVYVVADYFGQLTRHIDQYTGPIICRMLPLLRMIPYL